MKSRIKPEDMGVLICEKQGEISGFVGGMLSRFIQDCIRHEPELADTESEDFKAWEREYMKRKENRGEADD
ncbi:MAG: hypothetical protein IKI37_09080 [Oscillospiraceae bacterium]|nr:hypothetical protein [Oscillospiraceae bacterium]